MKVSELSKETSDAELSRQEQSYINAAIALARTSTLPQKHGAIIVRGGSIISVGVNRRRNNPQHDLEHATYHAEEIALRGRLKKTIQGGTLYVARVSKLDIPALSRPCNRCFTKLHEMGIKEIIYTNWSKE
jgi:deoxycytidylate deaminase